LALDSEASDLPPTPDHFEEGNTMLIEPTIDIELGIASKPQISKLGASCSLEEVGQYTQLFHEFHEVFAWEYSNMKGMDPDVILHNIITIPNINPIRQKQCPLAPKLSHLVKEEV